MLTLEQQAQRVWQQLQRLGTDLDRNLLLDQLRNRHEVLYFKVLSDHLTELMPVVYTPTVGRRSRNSPTSFAVSGASICPSTNPTKSPKPSRHWGSGPDDVDLIVCTDAEAILGIGDWGVNGIEIAVGKLALYTAGGGIDPRRTIAVALDVGTDNDQLLNDPFYLGNRHPRRRGAVYDEFIKHYIQTADRLFPHAILHFEDFGPARCACHPRHVCRRLLRVQRRRAGHRRGGDGRVVLGRCGFPASRCASSRWLCSARGRLGWVSPTKSATPWRPTAPPSSRPTPGSGRSTGQACCLTTWTICATSRSPTLKIARSWAFRPASRSGCWRPSRWPRRPSCLVPRRCTAPLPDVIEAMGASTPQPVIMPLSNPTSRMEAMPADVLAWSDGKALVATGSPIAPVEIQRHHLPNQVRPTMCWCFPGSAEGSSFARRAASHQNMLDAAAKAVASKTDPTGPGAALLPDMENLREISTAVAAAVYHAAVEDGVATKTPRPRAGDPRHHVGTRIPNRRRDMTAVPHHRQPQNAAPATSVVIVGSGFAGFSAPPADPAVTQGACLGCDGDDCVAGRLPALRAVAGRCGRRVDRPGFVTIPLAGTLKGVRTVRGRVDSVDFDEAHAGVHRSGGPDTDAVVGSAGVDPGIGDPAVRYHPGWPPHARGLKSAAEALYLRDHVLEQLELAHIDDDPARAQPRGARLSSSVRRTRVPSWRRSCAPWLMPPRSRWASIVPRCGLCCWTSPTT